jgi:hypothetical protein
MGDRIQGCGAAGWLGPKKKVPQLGSRYQLSYSVTSVVLFTSKLQKEVITRCTFRDHPHPQKADIMHLSQLTVY